MSYKRSRSTFEADLHQHAPYAIFGTPLPDDAAGRDNGEYLPLWKQDVRDEQGRRRLHGAFTGGWSAGYFNTVGSKEGWTPSTFVSSRSNKQKDGATQKGAPAPQQQQRPEDFMDEEDLADAAEAQKLQVSQSFAGLGSSAEDEVRAGGLMGLLRPQGENMGLQLLRKMGWRDGQGIGPKVRRSARLDASSTKKTDSDETYLFAPDDAPMVQFVRKTDRKGLGHDGQSKLSTLQPEGRPNDEDGDEEMSGTGSERVSLFDKKKSKKGGSKGGIGIGILNDTGSDDEDPYEIGPRIKYNRVMGGDKKKKVRQPVASVNPALKNAPVFLPKVARVGSLRRCHDGRLPLDGFILGKFTEDFSKLFSDYAPPEVPDGWASPRLKAAGASADGTYTTTADAAKASTLDPRSRAALLGEKALPGKSVFDFISSNARGQIASASGNAKLPPGRGEVPEGHAPTEEERLEALTSRIPQLGQETAVAALSRGSAGPYADDEAKRERYRHYLEYQAHPGQPPPPRPKALSEDDYIREMNEFHNCARIFKPMTGFMASRFTTAKSAPPKGTEDSGASSELLTQPEPKIADPAEEAAKMGMFGQMTRSVEEFFPTRLLCKRFNVRGPAHSRSEHDQDAEAKTKDAGMDAWPTFTKGTSAQATSTVKGAIEDTPKEQGNTEVEAKPEGQANPERNDAVEGETAHADVLKAIFGDSDSDE